MGSRATETSEAFLMPLMDSFVMETSVAVLAGRMGGLLVEIHAAVPFFIGAALAAGGSVCAWRLCTRLDRQIS